MAEKNKISALILAKNEQEMISDCVKQLDFVQEIVVLDLNSSDNTAQIARKLGAKVIQSDSEDFSHNRNLLAKTASGDWLLYVDADERFDNACISQIKKIARQEGKITCYFFPRKNIILGKWLKHGGWSPDYVPRLFKKEGLENWYGEVHESPKTKGEIFYLDTPITHLTARTLDLMFKKSIKWGEVEARLAFEANHPKVTILKIVWAAKKEFFSRYIQKLGFLDGLVGAIEAFYQAYHRVIVLTYLWELQNKNKLQGR